MSVDKILHSEIQKTVAIFQKVYYSWNQAGEETPTKARLTSLKTPEALPGAPKKVSLTPKNKKECKPRKGGCASTRRRVLRSSFVPFIRRNLPGRRVDDDMIGVE